MTNRTSTLLLALLWLAAQTAAAEPWRQLADPAEAGWSEEELAEARTLAEEAGSASVLVVENGNVVAAWGPIDRPLPLFSVRKGIYSALYGVAIDKGWITLDSSMGELGIDDLEGLSEREKTATVRHLLAARSGIFHPSSYEPSSMKRNRPKRGSSSPGERWFYNNWDFNALVTILERETGSTFEELFETEIARPLGFEDLSRDSVLRHLEPSSSVHPAAVMKISARDLARVGQLFLDRGRWDGEQIFPSSWVDEVWTTHTEFSPRGRWGEGNGFGYLWWIYAKDGGLGMPADVYLSSGNFGQVLAVVPERGLVFVHQTDTENGRGLETEEGYFPILQAILSAQPETAKQPVRLTPLDPDPFPGALPAPPTRTPIGWTTEALESFRGDWVAGGQIPVRIHVHQGRLFGQPVGVPLAETEILRDDADRLYSATVDLSLQVERDESGTPVRLTGRVNGRQMSIVRAPARRTDQKM